MISFLKVATAAVGSLLSGVVVSAPSNPSVIFLRMPGIVLQYSP